MERGGAKVPPLRLAVRPADPGPPAALTAWARLYVRALLEAEGVTADAAWRDAA